MKIFKKRDFERLSTVHDMHCVSIYLPTEQHTTGEDGTKKSKIHLKNQLKEASNQLQFFGLKESEIDNYLEPFKKLDSDPDFWTSQSEGLALFYQGDEILSYSLPMKVEPFAYVNDHFYLKPLANLTHGACRHFILSLSLKNAKIYDATSHGISEISVEELIPQDMRDTVGYELEEEHIQQRTGQGERGEAQGMFHGHGGGNENEKKEEALKYFQDINKGLSEMLREENVPLVIACVDYLFPIYKKANTYKNLVSTPVEGNYDDANKSVLKEKAWDLVKDYFDDERTGAEARFNALVNEGKSSSDPARVIPASMTGRTDVLFLKKGEQLWGRYNEKDHQIETHQVRRMGDSDLFNLAASHTINQGGKVYLVDAESMPLENSEVNGIFRYDYSS
ncbi:MAG TPA: hypothetical protein VJ949_11820 [Cryomorphaceae bacterium]|nr:hypothetical protein [Cryomorphaceae bacterium]